MKQILFILNSISITMQLFTMQVTKLTYSSQGELSGTSKRKLIQEAKYEGDYENIQYENADTMKTSEKNLSQLIFMIHYFKSF